MDTPLEATIEMNAEPARVWSIVADPRRIAQASPQVVHTVITNGPPIRVGTRLYNLNRRGLLLWPTRAKVIAYEPERYFAFRVKDNASIWSYTLEPLGDGRTRVIHRRETPQGMSPVSVRLQNTVLGGVEPFSAEMTAGMNRTLRRLKARVESLR